MVEKSGVEMIEDILVRVDTLEKKIDVIDYNIKILLNLLKATGKGAGARAESMPSPESIKNTVKQKIDSAKENAARTGAAFRNFSFEPAMPTEPLIGKPMIKNTVVKGKMVVDVEGKITPLASVSVKIYNDKDLLIKETRTNRAGQWISHLPPGKYIAMFDGILNGKKLVPQSRNFVVEDGKPELEVS